MSTRKDIEDLHNAYREEERATSNLAWNIKNREEIRGKLHQAHGDVVMSQQAVETAREKRTQLELKVGVE